MKTLRLTKPESAAYAAGERRFWRAMRKQPDIMHQGEPYWFRGGYRTHECATNPLPCPYGTPGDRIELTTQRHSLPPVIDTITAITVSQRDGKWGWVVEVGA